MQLKGVYALGRDSSQLTRIVVSLTVIEDVVVKGENILFDRLKFLATQKGVFLELVPLLELRQGTKEEWNAARHILDKVAVLFREVGGMVFEPSICLDLGNIRQDGVIKCVDVPGSFLC